VKKFVTAAVMAGMMCASGLAKAETLTAELCKQKVEEAAAILKAEGKAGMEKVKAMAVFADGQSYVWVHNLNSIMLMHPIKPQLEGQSIGDMRDANGVYLFSAFNEIAEEKGAGWVAYVWPKPGQVESSPKVSYVKLVEGDDRLVVGSGLYDVTNADIKAKFPGDAVYEN
jgi:methyl-accepting chemotaxis protein